MTAQPPTQLPAHLAASTVPGGERVSGLPDHVLIRQFYLGCLSQAAYLVGDLNTGRAIAVDPRRDVDELLAAAAEDGLSIEYVMQTHFHADFLSGHLELAAATGATIGYGSAAVTEFESRLFADGDVIDLGGVTVEVWETPGHTPESISLIVRAEPEGAPVAALTGDTLFIGDVGRPDLLVAFDVPADELAAKQYSSVHRMMTLPDDTLVLPAHGAGSACGKSLSSETISTIGEQRVSNYAVQPMDEATFVAIVTDGQPTTPGYFGYDATLNRKLRPIRAHNDAPDALDLAAFDRIKALGAMAVDVRSADTYAAGHLAGSISVPLTGRFAEQVGMFAGPGTPVLLIGDADAVTEAALRMSRIGFDNVAGALGEVERVLIEHPERSRRQSRLTAVEFADRRDALGESLQFVDVRNPGEVEAAPVEGAITIPLPRLSAAIDDAGLDPARPTVVVCAGGARSAIGSSVLEAAGFADVSDLVGGASALGIAAACGLGDR
ncbi:MAG: MBL fold metallo-hydrolase [Microthrixaceae bacterium]|nr:MBL fold metallo-hydrolase [Microthrixaceae bacterium]MCO5313250.1 MBL fold metallo-hydrolase [Microthrixaceae bacterium]